jgi:flagellar assembly protein FliH
MRAAMASRYMFNLDFGDARNLGQKPPEPTFSADELNAAREVAQAAGIEIGRAEAMASVERRLADALAAIGARLAEAGAERAAALARIEREAVGLCVGLMHKLFPAYQRRHGAEEIESLVRESLRIMVDEPRVVVRLNDANIDALKQRIADAASAAGFAGKVVLVGDEMVAPGDCTIEWADGGAERNGDRAWAEIDAVVRRIAETPPARARADAPADPTPADGE